MEAQARALGLAGWVRNLDDGRVEAYAIGPATKLDELAARLHQGPPLSIVRGLEQHEAEMQQLSSFRTK